VNRIAFVVGLLAGAAIGWLMLAAAAWSSGASVAE
jgi:hypothetical protein